MRCQDEKKSRLPKVWENKSDQDTIGFGFVSDCLTGWSDFFSRLIPEQI